MPRGSRREMMREGETTDDEYDSSSGDEGSSKKIGIIVGIILLAALLIVGIILLIVFASGGSSDSATTAPTAAPVTPAPTPVGGTAAPTPPPTSAPTAAPTPPPYPAPFPAREGPLTEAKTPEAAAAFLNQQYSGYDANDEGSPLGLTITMVSTPDSIYKNIFCSTFNNPIQQSGCYDGHADCRLSFALYNWQMLVTAADGFPELGLDRPTGYVLNPALVQSKYVKCSGIWDLATNNKYNNGCGDGAPAIEKPASDERPSCESEPDMAYPQCFNNVRYQCDGTVSKQTAFWNRCGYQKGDLTSGHTCTPQDDEVKRYICEGVGGTVPVPAIHSDDPQCLFPGVAFDYQGQESWKPDQFKAGNLRKMVEQRIKNNNGSSHENGPDKPPTPNIELWNEVVVDVRTIVQDMYEDPAKVIEAFIFSSDNVDHNRDQSKAAAEKMQQEYCTANQVLAVNCPPVIEVDIGVKGTPFKVPA